MTAPSHRRKHTVWHPSSTRQHRVYLELAALRSLEESSPHSHKILWWWSKSECNDDPFGIPELLCNSCHYIIHSVRHLLRAYHLYSCVHPEITIVNVLSKTIALFRVYIRRAIIHAKESLAKNLGIHIKQDSARLCFLTHKFMLSLKFYCAKSCKQTSALIMQNGMVPAQVSLEQKGQRGGGLCSYSRTTSWVGSRNKMEWPLLPARRSYRVIMIGV